MTTVKRLKSLDISSVTIMVTAISIIFSIIISIVLLIAMGIVSVNYVGVIGFLVPSLICGTIVVAVYRSFIEGFLYNVISKKTSIAFGLEDDGTVSKISTTSTALILAIISTVMIIIEYVIGLLLIPLILSSAIQTLMMSGQNAVAYSLYQILMMISNPVYIIVIIIGAFIVSFIYILIGTYIYNLIAEKGYGVKLNIINDSSLESIDVKTFALSIGLICLILGLISGIINAVTSGDYFGIIISVVVNFVAGYVSSAIIAIFYNKLAPRIGSIKFKLVDE